MERGETLSETLAEYCGRAVASCLLSRDVAVTIDALSGAAVEISALIAHGDLAGPLAAPVGYNSDGDIQKALDLRTHAIIRAALQHAPVAVLLSEESEEVETLGANGTLAVAVDPLDGSANIETNTPMGTIFSILPHEGSGALGPFSATGHCQLAAGFFLYGPHTALILTVGEGTHIFTLDPADLVFRLTRPSVRVREGCSEYAINASNYRHWESPVRVYIDDCLSGKSGLRGADFNMRWHGSVVAEAFRIIQRGGIFLYPADSRSGYQHGRLRLLYEAAPIAFLVEQAGGMASTGRGRILDIVPASLHQRVPLIFGARDKVLRLERLHTQPESAPSPLFAERGLLRS